MKRLLFLLLLLVLLSGISTLQAQEMVRPKSGDGIESLLRRHNRQGAQYRKEFLELNKGKFGKNNSLILERNYLLPPIHGNAGKPVAPSATLSSSVSKKGYEPLFGKKEANYEITSSELRGATFYLVSGHGGPDPGAIGKMDKHELHEDEYAYDIVLRLAKSLLSKGATVHIIIQDALDGIRDDRILKNSKRETCMGKAIPLKQTERLKQRSDKINEIYRKSPKGYSRAIFIHIDSRSKHKQTDVFFYHSSSAASTRLANTMKKTFAQKYSTHQPGRGFTGTVSERRLYVLRNTLPVGVYVELGNIQNPFDQRRIVMKDNRQALAKWIAEAFVADYKQSGLKK
ncbi:N-acetylmuramoyl-L-alanine amidase [Bacteroides sp. 214]|uniref:N-acetylmuramoyl-L-alanine amidase family protein n=1 Tax=Bacteroides sp. 214 TaxID=2302935 RepID=UPI0013D452D3|nr:N-acetylmuramoyl-L-alanine amidase [Bacteroides sp. 214]NDW11314.1 N-acetylmuramoyl-L-alanine amidase [Bacteroides sp. 214]